MKLYEYEAKSILASFGVPMLRGRLAATPEEARNAAAELGSPVVIKAQVTVAGRGKAGGIRLAATPEEAYRVAANMLGGEVKGLKVAKVLVEEAAEVRREMYLSITNERASKSYIILASPIGGVDIEEIAREQPDKVLRTRVDPLAGLRDFQVRRVVRWLGFEGDRGRQVEAVLRGMYRAFLESDADLVETNPLAELADGRIVPLDARMIIDDNALYRHPDLQKAYEEDPRDVTQFEAAAKKVGFSYVELDGDIGVIGNGAGLTMATMDLVYAYGGRPANFLDIGGGANREVVYEAVKLLLNNQRVKAIFINIFGGITRTDEVARGVEQALREVGRPKPIVVRLKGTNEEEGRRILAGLGIEMYDFAEDAAQRVVRLAGQ